MIVVDTSVLAYLFLPGEETDNLLAKIGEAGESEVDAVLKLVPEESRGLAHRTLAWLTKLNVVRVVSARKRTGG